LPPLLGTVSSQAHLWLHSCGCTVWSPVYNCDVALLHCISTVCAPCAVQKLQLFREFYIMVVAYIYFTRIVV
jgi:hypothetical protein